MPLTPHRRHAITSLLSVVGPICLYQYLLAPNLTVFLIRLVTQTRSSTPRIAHPSSSLLTLSFGVTLANLLAVFLHWLDDTVDMEKGLVLDFVGLKTRPTFLQVLLIDAFLFFYQLFTLYVAYLADPIPPGSADKLLLPSKPSRSRSKRKRTVSGRPEDAGLGLGLETSNEENVIDLGRDDEDEDLNVYDDEYERESLLHRANRRSSYLSTDATERSTSPSSSSPPSSSTTPPPLIFVIPHVHTLLHTIFTNPSPDDPTPSFAGATPTLLPRTSRELDRAEEGQAPGTTPPAGQTGRIPGGLNDRGFW